MKASDEVEDVATTTFSVLQGWIAQGTIPEIHPPPPTSGLLSPGSLKALIDYYRSKRLHYQMVYLSKAVRRDQKRDRHTRVVGPALFFGSVAFVLAHLAVEIRHGAEDWSRLLILIAAALPAMGAGFRIDRAATECARNAARFEAVHHILSALSERLRMLRTRQPFFASSVFANKPSSPTSASGCASWWRQSGLGKVRSPGTDMGYREACQGG